MDFILRKFLVFCFLVLIGFSCKSNSEKSSEKEVENASETEETPFSEKLKKYVETTITRKGKKKSFSHKEVNKNQVLEIKKIIELNQELEFYEKKLIDITGEGNLDTIEVRIDKIGKNDFRVTNSIITHGKVAWDDTLEINKEEFFYGNDWWEDSTYYKLLPYSNFIVAKDYADFIVDNFDYSFWKEEDGVAQGVLQTYLKNKDLLDQFTPASGKFIEIFKDFKGKTITDIGLMDRETFIWFEPTQEFILLHSP